MKYQVYKVKNNETGHYYIGMHKGDIFEDNYWGSGRGIREYIQKHGKENLERILLHEFTNKDECERMEESLISWDIVKDPFCLNRQPGGVYQGERSESTKERISKTMKEIQNRSEVKERIRAKSTGRRHTEESKRKMRENMLGPKNHRYGTKPSEETRKRLSESRVGEKHHFFGKNLTDEHKEKLSKSHKGKKHSKETKEKLSKLFSGKNNPMYGRKVWEGKNHSEETKHKISESLKGVKHSEARIQNIRKSLTGRKLSEEHKDNIRRSVKESWRRRREEDDIYQK